MSFLLKSKPKRSLNFTYVGIVLFFLVLLLLSMVLPGFFRTSSHYALKPIWFLKDKTAGTFQYVINYIKLQNFLVKEKIRLEDEIAGLRLTKIDYEFLQKENEELRADLGRDVAVGKLISNVLSKPPQSPFDTFVIDIGENQGLVLGNRVYTSQDIILGTVSEVSGNTGIVSLFSGPGVVTYATLSRTGASFNLKGNGGANFELEVPKDTDILWGDNFLDPESLAVIATVGFIDVDSQNSFKTIHLKVPGNVFETKRVFVEK